MSAKKGSVGKKEVGWLTLLCAFFRLRVDHFGFLRTASLLRRLRDNISEISFRNNAADSLNSMQEELNGIVIGINAPATSAEDRKKLERELTSLVSRMEGLRGKFIKSLDRMDKEAVRNADERIRNRRLKKPSA